jgi:hypothetical protein
MLKSQNRFAALENLNIGHTGINTTWESIKTEYKGSSHTV